MAAEKAIPSEPRHAAVFEKTLSEAVVAHFQNPGRAVGSRWDNLGTKQERKASLGDDWVYTRSRGKAKMEIPDKTLAIDYRGGERYPHLERIEGQPDLLGSILGGSEDNLYRCQPKTMSKPAAQLQLTPGLSWPDKF